MQHFVGTDAFYIRNTVICSITPIFFLIHSFFFQRGRVKETDKTIQTGEKGRTHMGEDKIVEEEEESGEKARAGRPLLPASQPALSPKR